MNSLWDRYQKHLLRSGPPLGFAVDLSRMRFDDAFFGRMERLAQRAFTQARALEAGAIAVWLGRFPMWERHFAANDPALHLTLQSGPSEDTFRGS
jgi:hypothetical protein